MTTLELLQIIAVLSFAAMFSGMVLGGSGYLGLGGSLIGVGFITFLVIAIAFSEVFPCATSAGWRSA